ncbi:MAG: radical SAM protein [Ruminococcaceae bacterium]|nr:radical SAM protein [Oscillospiraceae bacterium]
MCAKHKTIPIFVPHWGCPQDCLFCNQKVITGQKEEMTGERAAEIIAAGLQNKKPGDVVEIGFFGGSFTGIPAKTQEALLTPAYEALSAGAVDGIRLSTRPDYISDSVLARMKRFGVTTIELGAQSMHDDVLLRCNRGHSAEQTEQAAKQIKEAGFSLGLQMMLGLPGDSFEKAVMTAERFIALAPGCVRIYPTLVLKGTGLATEYEAGRYQPVSLEDAVEQCAVLYDMFQKHNIDVIRMGLLDMEPEAICAGPYHPAFGELAMSRVCYKQLAEKVAPFTGKRILIKTHPRFVSTLVGQKRMNIRKLQTEFDIKQIEIEQDCTLGQNKFIILQNSDAT